MTALKKHFKHFQGGLRHLFLPSLLCSWVKSPGDFLVSHPNWCICTHILTLLLQAHQPARRWESETRGCAQKKKKISWRSPQGMPGLHFCETLSTSRSVSDVFAQACWTWGGVKDHVTNVSNARKDFLCTESEPLPWLLSFQLAGFSFLAKTTSTQQHLLKENKMATASPDPSSGQREGH